MLFASRRGALNLMGGSQEDQVLDIFAEVGTVKNIQMNLDRQTGFVKVRRHVEHRTYQLSRRPVADVLIGLRTSWATGVCSDRVW